MSVRGYLIAGAAAGFVMLLVHATYDARSSAGGPEPGALAAATEACERAVRERVDEARFPFDATVRDLGNDRLELSGSVDSGSGAGTIRQNYSCWLRDAVPGSGYAVDSVHVWQSH